MELLQFYGFLLSKVESHVNINLQLNLLRQIMHRYIRLTDDSFTDKKPPDIIINNLVNRLEEENNIYHLYKPDAATIHTGMETGFAPEKET